MKSSKYKYRIIELTKRNGYKVYKIQKQKLNFIHRALNIWDYVSWFQDYSWKSEFYTKEGCEKCIRQIIELQNTSDLNEIIETKVI